MTYASLLTDLRRYLERGTVSDTEVYAQLPSLVNTTERDLATKLKILGQLNVVVSSMVAGTSVYAKPNRWRQTASINFGVGTSPNQTRTPLFPRSYEYCRSYWPNSETRSRPEFYADYDYNNWLIVPTPDAAYPFEANYYQLLPLLDDVNQTNWFTDYAPQLLLYGALLQCVPFLIKDDRIPTWEKFYNEQLGAWSTQDVQGVIDRTTVRRGV